MNANETAELEGLLSEAMKSLTIRRPSVEPLSVADFRVLLQGGRTKYDPSSKYLISSCRPELSQVEVKQKLVDFVSRQLANYIRDGKIHSATIAFFGERSGSSIEDVACNLLKLTIVDGPAKASQAFADCTTNSCCRYYRFFLITGVRIPAPFEVFDGITLIPLPESVSELPAYLPPVPTESNPFSLITAKQLLGRTLVRVEYEVSPIFHKPAEAYTLDSDRISTSISSSRARKFRTLISILSARLCR